MSLDEEQKLIDKINKNEARRQRLIDELIAAQVDGNPTDLILHEMEKLISEKLELTKPSIAA